MVAPDPHARGEHLAAGPLGCCRAQFPDRGGLRDGDIVEDPEAADDDADHQQVLEVDGGRELGKVVLVLVGEPGQPGRVHGERAERRRDRQADQRSRKRRRGAQRDPVRDVEDDEHDGRRAREGDGHARLADDDRRQHEADQHPGRHAEADHGHQAAEACDGEHRDNEQHGERDQDGQPVDAAERVVDAVGGVDAGNLDPVARLEAVVHVGAGQLDGVLGARIGPGGDVDRDREAGSGAGRRLDGGLAALRQAGDGGVGVTDARGVDHLGEGAVHFGRARPQPDHARDGEHREHREQPDQVRPRALPDLDDAMASVRMSVTHADNLQSGRPTRPCRATGDDTDWLLQNVGVKSGAP